MRQPRLHTDTRNLVSGRLRARNSSARGAFTLLELLLAMAVFAALAAVVIPVAGTMLSDRRLVRGGDQLQAEIIRLRVRAMREGRVFTLQAFEGSSQLQIAAIFSAADATESMDAGNTPSALLSGADQAIGTVVVDELTMQSSSSTIDLPEDIVVSNLLTSPVGGDQTIEAASLMSSTSMASQDSSDVIESDGAALPTIYFYPNGKTSNAIIVLSEIGVSGFDDSEPSAVTRQVQLRGLTGGTEVR